MFIERNFLTQTVSEPTRGDNVLDLVFTNRTQDVLQVTTQVTKLSDHHLVECLLSFNPVNGSVAAPAPHDPLSFRAVNYYKNLNEGKEVDVIYLDYSKAFDKVDHQTLLAKMKLYGINNKTKFT